MSDLNQEERVVSSPEVIDERTPEGCFKNHTGDSNSRYGIDDIGFLLSFRNIVAKPGYSYQSPAIIALCGFGDRTRVSSFVDQRNSMVSRIINESSRFISTCPDEMDGLPSISDGLKDADRHFYKQMARVQVAIVIGMVDGEPGDSYDRKLRVELADGNFREGDDTEIFWSLTREEVDNYIKSRVDFLPQNTDFDLVVEFLRREGLENPVIQ